MLEGRRVDLIIPAYNESERLGGVLKTVCAVSWLDQIIVVNDCSTDKTASIASAYKVKLINLAVNMGKGAALQRGIEAAEADILEFIDADLIGLTETHLKLLVNPLLFDDDLFMVVGRFSGGRLVTNLSQRLAPILNGQRALRREFVAALPDLSPHRYGVEIFISNFAAENNYKQLEAELPGLSQVLKEEKEGVVKGTISRYRMYGQLLKTWRKSRRKN